MSQYPSLNVADHVALGNELKAAGRAITTVMQSFPKTSRVAHTARSVEYRLGTLQSVLDDEICRVTRDHDPRNMAIKVYYGDQPLVQRTADDNTNDAFAAWEVE